MLYKCNNAIINTGQLSLLPSVG